MKRKEINSLVLATAELFDFHDYLDDEIEEGDDEGINCTALSGDFHFQEKVGFSVHILFGNSDLEN